jgi:hypothetical protein
MKKKKILLLKNFIIKNNLNMDGEYVYTYSGQELRFTIYHDHIVNISLQYNNLYKF